MLFLPTCIQIIHSVFQYLIITPWVMGRESKLSLYGPPKLKQMAEKYNTRHMSLILITELPALSHKIIQGTKLILSLFSMVMSTKIKIYMF